jgi:hypothetical protein
MTQPENGNWDILEKFVIELFALSFISYVHSYSMFASVGKTYQSYM